MNRIDFQQLADVRIDEAMVLLAQGKYDGAYYLAGYAVECGLKACIARQFAADVIPDKGFVNNIYKHEFKTLVGLAGLTAELKTAQDRDPSFASSWAIVSQW